MGMKQKKKKNSKKKFKMADSKKARSRLMDPWQIKIAKVGKN